MPTITRLTALEILDSRGRPTISATCTLADGAIASASIPSGASTGKHEAHELRDGDPKRYGGKGVLKAVANVNDIIARELKSEDALDQRSIDQRLIELDATPRSIPFCRNFVFVTNRSSPTSCIRAPSSSVSAFHPSQSFSAKPSSIEMIG